MHRRARAAALLLILALIAGLAAACTLPPPAQDIVTAAATKNATRSTPHATTAPTAGATARVTRVVDGDTIRVQINGVRYTVRYIGIDTPEMDDPDPEVRALAQRATAANAALVAGKTVRLERDVSETDRYGRLLRYVYVGDTLVNAELVRQGLADAVRYPPDVKHQRTLTEMEEQARRARRGMWTPPP